MAFTHWTSPRKLSSRGGGGRLLISLWTLDYHHVARVVKLVMDHNLNISSQ